jgi:multisubunit Na+/H+ antiporter MnhB subunit
MNSETKQVLIAWTKQFGIAMAVYIAAVVAATVALRSQPAGAMRTALVLAPIVPGLSLIWFTVRSYKRCDEYIQLRMLRSASLIIVVLAALSLTYCFLELLGLPRLSAQWVSNIISGMFVVQMVRLLATGK